MKTRATISVDDDLLQWVHEYAKRERTTLSHLINDSIRLLKEKEEREQRRMAALSRPLENTE